MQKIDIDDMNPESGPQNRQSVSEPLDAQDFSMNYYALEPGEEFAGSLHTHLDQEESFSCSRERPRSRRSRSCGG